MLPTHRGLTRQRRMLGNARSLARQASITEFAQPFQKELNMTAPMDDFRLEWHGNTVIITPSPNVEQMPWDLIEEAADIVMEPLKSSASPMAVIDLSQVTFFGSAFLALLLRCHTAVKSRGGELVLSGPSKVARDLLKLTALDTLWAIYETRAEAVDAVDS